MGDIKILLVDDEENFVRTISERLDLRDLTSHTAFNGEQALGYVGDREPDVMVLDLRMPGIDGMEVLRQVRQNYPDIQVIIQTGHGNDLDEVHNRKPTAQAPDSGRGQDVIRSRGIIAGGLRAERTQEDAARAAYLVDP